MRITNFVKIINIFTILFALFIGVRLFLKPGVVNAQTCGSSCNQIGPGSCSINSDYASSCGTGTGICSCLFAVGCTMGATSCDATYVNGPAPASCCGGVSCTGTPGCTAPGDCVGGHLCQPGAAPCDSVLVNSGPACGGGGSTPTPTPSGGGTPSCSPPYWCTSSASCSASGGTASSGAGYCSNSTDVICCAASSGGGTGTPPPSGCGPLGCLNSICGGPCIVTADCAKSTSGEAVYCKPLPGGGGVCANPTCVVDGVDYTQPGTTCLCKSNTPYKCGQPCAGPCGAGSMCTFVSGVSCPGGAGTTYCTGSKPGDATGYYYTNNPQLVRPKCDWAAVGNSFLYNQATGQSSGFSQAQIQSTCSPLPVITFTATGGTPPQTGTTITIPSGTSATLNWSTTNATSCSAIGAWNGTKSTSGTEQTANLTVSAFYTLNCIGSGGTATATVNVNVAVLQCATPTPIDPPASTCSPTPTGTGSVTWKWNRVPLATQYQIRIYNAVTNNQIIDSGMLPAATFSCGALGCTYTTINMAIGSYYSRIQASGLPACSISALSGPSATVTVGLCPAIAWWQCGDGDVYGGGNVSSKIPFTCTTPACTPSLIVNSPGVSPGVATYGGNLDLGIAGGSPSSTNWNANSSYLGKQYDYAYFSSLTPSSVLADANFNLPSSTATNTTFNTGGSSSGGYRWYKSSGDLTISGNVTISGKVILFVEGGNLNINGRIALNSASDFFLAIVQNNTNVDQSITNGNNPALTGLFFNGGSFNTGAGNTKLVVDGAVVATTVNLQRDLGGALNNTTPAEFVQYDPTQIVNFPRQLSRRNVIWKEVAP
ncbi:hypothetical protein HYS03_02015 [Candidatus Woesebacteria bacterium]|nr:hypothetical protein [Candidatus Woesebacteria bacterium]QQG47463.1 MAG: hypothetical protein HY044_05075 [Candidatus Woesebacteria bacterium]